MRRLLAAAALAQVLPLAPAHAGGTPENAVLIIDPSDPVSLRVGNAYRAARNIPESNIIFQRSAAADYPAFVAGPQASFQATLSARGVLDRVDYIVLAPTSTFYLAAPGLIDDNCSPVNRFSVTTAYTLSQSTGDVFTLDANALPVATGNDSAFANRYYGTSDTATYFSSATYYNNGSVSTGSVAAARRYYISALLGYTGTRGNSVDEILSMISRSAAVDGTRTSGNGGGTFYFMNNTGDAARNVRNGLFSVATTGLNSRGASTSTLTGVLPPGSTTNALGVSTGAITLAPPANLLLSGAFADHLTSFAGNYDDASQSKLSVWISAGASGSAGTVDEPCNYTGKFPHPRFYTWYFQGLSLGEAYLRSMQYTPFQSLLVGDPLTRPFARLPNVNAPTLPAQPVSGSFAFTPSATATAPSASIAYYELLVDGVRVAGVIPSTLITVNTSTLDDGWHDLRLLARDNAAGRNVGRWLGSLVTNNFGRSAALSVNLTSGNLATPFVFTVSAAGGPIRETRLISNGQVVAAGLGDLAPLTVYGQVLGAGTVPVRAEVVFADHRVARSAPVTVTVDPSGTITFARPVAYSFSRRLAPSGPQLIEFPVATDAPPDQTYLTVRTLTQAVVAGSGRYRTITPNPGATGQETLTFSAWVPNGGGASNTAAITISYAAPRYCALDYNADGLSNLDDLGDFITDFYMHPAIPAGPQPTAPTYTTLTFPAFPCPGAPNAPAPYPADAFRRWGYRAGFSPDGTNLCPSGPGSVFPNLDNLNDYITAFYDPANVAACQ